MAPLKSKKRGSNSSTRGQNAMTGTKTPLRAASPATPQRSPHRKHRQGITIRQKQALIDNLQLEVTERARRLRSQCNMQAQGLRARIDIRINRIPTAIRKMKMRDLLLKVEQQETNRVLERRPTLPAKDGPFRPSPQKAASDPARVPQIHHTKKRISDEISGDKENAGVDVDYPKKKKARSNHTDAEPVRPVQVLSPTSSNSRLTTRERTASPTKSQIARPGSPLKSAGASRSAATNVLSSMVEKAKASRALGHRNVTNTSHASSASSQTTGAGKGRKPAVPSTRAPVSRPATRLGRRGSVDTETSEGSSAPAAKRGTALKPTASATKRGVLGSMRKGIAGVGQPKSTAKTTTGRTLRSKKGQ